MQTQQKLRACRAVQHSSGFTQLTTLVLAYNNYKIEIFLFTVRPNFSSKNEEPTFVLRPLLWERDHWGDEARRMCSSPSPLYPGSAMTDIDFTSLRL